MEDCESEANGPQHESELHPGGSDVVGLVIGPFGAGGGAVGAEVAAYGDGVGDLEDDGEKPDEEVDRGYGGGDEGEEDGAIEVVDYLVGRKDEVSLCV